MKITAIDASTETKKLHKYQLEKIVNIAIEWCMSNFGVRKWCPNLMVEIVKEAMILDSGWYSPDRHNPEITVNLAGNPTLIDLIDTVIHEYTHYLQPNFEKIYQNFSETYEYKNNPLEIEAFENAKRYKNECFKYIKNTTQCTKQ